MLSLPQRSTLFPYTTLFRSHLEVLTKRPDGYHEIETLMVAVTLHDTLKFREEPGGQIRLTCNHPELSTGSDNLVIRAAKDRKSTRLNSSHTVISYAVFCLKK